MLVCKGSYIILQGGPPIEKASKVTFDFYYLEPRFSLKEDIKRLIFSKEKIGAALYSSEKKNFSF